MITTPGTYRARAVGAELSTTSTGKEQIAVQFQLLEHEGETLLWFGYFTERALPITVRALRACGWQGNDLQDLTGILDNEVDLVCANEEYNGTTRLKVQFVNRPGEMPFVQPMEDTAARSFAARMKGQIAALGGASGRRSAPSTAAPRSARAAQTPEPPPHGDDDGPPF